MPGIRCSLLRRLFRYSDHLRDKCQMESVLRLHTWLLTDWVQSFDQVHQVLTVLTARVRRKPRSAAF